jgi:hypothetical protein
MTTPSTIRKRSERQRRKTEGLKRLEQWAHPDDHPAIKAYVASLRAKREKHVP